VDNELERRERANRLSNVVLGAAIEVHRHLGPGLLESSYETCLCHELTLLQVPFERQLPLPISYKGISVDAAYKIDILVEGLVILEIKSVEKLHPIHQAQLLTYLRLSNLWLGLLINFNVKTLKEGIKRIVNG
jgi:GxxExxY protein